MAGQAGGISALMVIPVANRGVSFSAPTVTPIFRKPTARRFRVSALPHASLLVPLAAPEPTNGTGSARKWRPCTPAMAAGLTDRVWTLRDVLLYRVPPWPQPQG
jgi:hypothetical protein